MFQYKTFSDSTSKKTMNRTQVFAGWSHLKQTLWLSQKLNPVKFSLNLLGHHFQQVDCNE